MLLCEKYKLYIVNRQHKILHSLHIHFEQTFKTPEINYVRFGINTENVLMDTAKNRQQHTLNT